MSSFQKLDKELKHVTYNIILNFFFSLFGA